MAEIFWKALRKDVIEPRRGSEEAAGWDIYSVEDAWVPPYKAMTIPTGLAVQLPKGTALWIMPRSGYAIRNQLIMPNSMGLIDEDYRGELLFSALWTPSPEEVLQINPVEIGSAIDGIPRDLPKSGLIKINKDKGLHIPAGHRIAQAVLVEYKEQVWKQAETLTPTKRGDSGVGSTGLR